ncbi:hypothetical protein BE221DRAFT_63502 [Ostreococcus tauri]|uniref:Ferroxidase n=1 Tax=Ostreococcus tauri TaxID=70448 RepID=A0A1Y5HXQ4_OSTTA|nr:hypothetical protein BE221DRAFT_63502 [Ostreococcus tauri]
MQLFATTADGGHQSRLKYNFNDSVDRILRHIHDTVEVWSEDAGVRGSDTTFEMGVVTLSFGSRGTFVLNKQTPVQELWLSSPVSGPSHYTFCDRTRTWRDKRSRVELLPLLEQEIHKISSSTGLKLRE